jgi:hypothetical protein
METRRQYLDRFLKSKLYEVVQHYDKQAMANPPVVKEVIEEIIDVLEPACAQCNSKEGHTAWCTKFEKSMNVEHRKLQLSKVDPTP